MSSAKQRPVSKSTEKERVHTQTGVQASTTGTTNAKTHAMKKCHMAQLTTKQDSQNQHPKRVHQPHQ